MEEFVKARARVALVGAGAIAQSYVRVLANSQVGELVAIADVDVERARTIAGPLDIPVFANHRDLLVDTACDGIIVCTPPAYHMEVAIDALRSGVHVLCEKPLAIGAFAARRMFAAATENRRLLTMASKFRLVDDIIRAKELMNGGTIGNILRIENTFMAAVDMSNRWNSRIETSGGGVIIDNGTHSVDIMRFLLGPLTAAYAVDTSVDSRYDRCDDTASLFVRNAAGVVGAIALSWAFGSGDETYLRIFGSEGRIDVGWRSATCTRFGDAPVEFGRGYDKVRAFTGQIENFIGAMTGQELASVSERDAIASVEVIDAAYDSMRKNTWSVVEVRRLTPFEKLMEPDTAVSVAR